MHAADKHVFACQVDQRISGVDQVADALRVKVEGLASELSYLEEGFRKLRTTTQSQQDVVEIVQGDAKRAR